MPVEPWQIGVAMSTITLSRETREMLRILADRHGETVAAVLLHSIRQLFWDEIDAAYTACASSHAAQEAFLAETRDWDHTALFDMEDDSGDGQQAKAPQSAAVADRIERMEDRWMQADSRGERMQPRRGELAGGDVAVDRNHRLHLDNDGVFLNSRDALVCEIEMDGLFIILAPKLRAALLAEAERNGLSLYGLVRQALQVTIAKGMPALMVVPDREVGE
jgi:hypothetical protein